MADIEIEKIVKKEIIKKYVSKAIGCVMCNHYVESIDRILKRPDRDIHIPFLSDLQFNLERHQQNPHCDNCHRHIEMRSEFHDCKVCLEEICVNCKDKIHFWSKKCVEGHTKFERKKTELLHINFKLNLNLVELINEYAS